MDKGSLKRVPDTTAAVDKNEAVSPQQAQFLAHQQEQQQEEYYTQYYQPTQAEMQYYYQQQQLYAANPQQYQQYQQQYQAQFGNSSASSQGHKNQIVPGPGANSTASVHSTEKPDATPRNGGLGATASHRTSNSTPTPQKDPLVPPKLQKYINPKQQLWLEKYLCCCCPSRKRHRLICCGFLVVILIAVILLLYFYLPRFPDTKVYSINIMDIANSNTPYSFTYKDPANPNLNDVIFKMNLSMSVGTYNPNLYGLNVDRIDLMAQLMVNTTYVFNPLMTTSLQSYGSLVQAIGPPPKNPNPQYVGKNDSIIGSASREAIYFPSREWVNYTMMFEFSYTPDPQIGLLADPTILELADSCGITSRYKPAGRAMKIQYTATSTISSLKALNYAPSLSNSLYIKCPFSSEQINLVIQEVKDGKSPYDAIREVFGGGSTPGQKTRRSRRHFQE
ncbi:hypothetical protein BDR26DRAFT_858387 [Obelidium mucronatum]|nr:hypothetical protein BDR26DRAFT_858387 [Obelidium mucronatum]